MDNKNYEVMQNFNINNIPSLSICVLGALEFLSSIPLPKISVRKKDRILVVGSGNALVVGKMIFSKYDATFRTESTYIEELTVASFDHAFLISASGGKHAPGIAKVLKKKRIKTSLITNNLDAKAQKFVDKTYFFPRMKEPYTYNTSTYISIIIGYTKESIPKIYRNVKKVDKNLPKNLPKYSSFYFIIPTKFDAVKEMFETKFDELFGPKIMGKVFTVEEIKHAKTVVNSKDELFVSMGFKNYVYGLKKNRYELKIPKNINFGEFLAIGYYFIGKIQEANPNYFGKNINNYTMEASKLFNEKISAIVE
ncbi:MAG: hypothetical protein IH845_02645 [Nanoarchaeota archaeon]|nr:hypothetical protein [Nanoarchaeota archaeon]